MIHKKYVFIVLFLMLQKAFSACTILDSSKNNASKIKDGISALLSSGTDCPKDVFEFRAKIKANHLQIETTMVANRGYHNPSQGSFSFFEMVTGKLDSITVEQGDFFLGHFTTTNENNELIADQGLTTAPRLMIEAFAWDNDKKLFNFYELIGDGKHNQWFYRGDSADIYADNTLLHRQSDPAHPQFGERLRCSGCHAAGGPIMKEIHAPHNDWWEPVRKLDFGGRKFNESLSDIIDNLLPPQRLAENVIVGIKKLTDSRIRKEPHNLSLQEELRPLFCPVEVNFVSDKTPNQENERSIKIPAEFFINKKFVGNQIVNIVIEREAYEKALIATGSHFPETPLLDADHAWLAPVKASSDQLAIDHLIKAGLIDDKFAFDVLSIDMTNPVFSKARCGLLKYVPNAWSIDWKNKFIQNLTSSSNKVALKLLNHITNTSHTPKYHQQDGLNFLKRCVEQAKNEKSVKKLFLLLIQRRIEIKASEISKNRRGQILEPGFRVIFPESDIKITRKLKLTKTCEVKEFFEKIDS